MQENTLKLIEPDYGTEALNEAHCDSNRTLDGMEYILFHVSNDDSLTLLLLLLKQLQCDLSEDFHMVLILKHNITLLDWTVCAQIFFNLFYFKYYYINFYLTLLMTKH
uniref:Uncharacterized protein n=1 Tax=Sipha flava TaxID=143950 RepID=A0A2S2RC08_9HEMI